MNAVVHDRYGPPEVLRIEDVDKPVPKDDEILVKIHATTVNRTDTGLRSADYWISRFFTGLLRAENGKRRPYRGRRNVRTAAGRILRAPHETTR